MFFFVLCLLRSVIFLLKLLDQFLFACLISRIWSFSLLLFDDLRRTFLLLTWILALQHFGKRQTDCRCSFVNECICFARFLLFCMEPLCLPRLHQYLVYWRVLVDNYRKGAKPMLRWRDFGDYFSRFGPNIAVCSPLSHSWNASFICQMFYSKPSCFFPNIFLMLNFKPPHKSVIHWIHPAICEFHNDSAWWYAVEAHHAQNEATSTEFR